ncbi:immunoglobulin superfamily member 1-like [Carassius auratus]|uniref:immunoglobulin superfamily member 1-like n=1 Tax=Carassius auratus TaxID=7957 RepID=UPI000E427685|nr:immunoglobulin superfamily member 1-like [Carassius auratus]
MGLSQLPLVLLLISNIHSGQTEGRPKPTVTITPAQPVFRGETVTLRCDIYGGGVNSWRYYWYKEGLYSVFSDQKEHTFRSITESDAGKYSCDGFIGSNGSNRSDTVTLTVSDFPKLTLTVKPQSSVFTGDSVTLRCEGIQSQYGWEFLWRKDSNTETIEAATKTINRVKVSDRGEYSCRARRRECYTDYSVPVMVKIYEKPKPTVKIKPAQHVFRGETVTLRCDIYGGVNSWRYYWYKEGLYSVFSVQQEYTFRSITESDAGKYSCDGFIGSNGSNRSDKVTLTVSDFPKLTLTVEPQSSVFTGDSVTLRCEGIQSQYGWEFLWRKDSNTETIEAATKTINRVKVSDRGEYSCRARRREYYTEYSVPVMVKIYGKHFYREQI